MKHTLSYTIASAILCLTLSPTLSAQTSAAVEQQVVVKQRSPFTLSGALHVYPLAYDNLTSGSDEEDVYIGLSPSLSLKTEFDTAGGRTVSFSASYALTFRHFVTGNNDVNVGGASDYKHGFTLKSGIDLNPKLSLSLLALADYYHAAADIEKNELWSQVDPKLTYQVLPTTSLYVGYTFAYYLHYNSSVLYDGINEYADFPSGPDDLGNFIIEGGSPILGPVTDPYTIYADPKAKPFSNETFFFRHGLILGVSHTFVPGTTGGLGYRIARIFSDNDGIEHVENWGMASLSQSLWNNASGSIAYRLRLRNYVYEPGANPAEPLHDSRQRFYLSLNQKLNDNFGLETAYRYQMGNGNKPSKVFGTHQFWMGGYVSF